jgi:hypothetical protein
MDRSLFQTRAAPLPSALSYETTRNKYIAELLVKIILILMNASFKT